MRMARSWSHLVFAVQVLVLLSLMSFDLAAQTKVKKKSRKDPPAAESTQAVTDAKPTEVKDQSPFRDLITLLEQAPRFSDFPKSAFQGTLAMVAVLGKEVLFLDGCQATILRKNWTVTQCKVARAAESDMLAKLALMGGDVSADTDNAVKLNALFAALRKVKALAELDGLMAPSVDTAKDGYKPAPEMEKDFEACGTKRYADAMASLPNLAGLGANVVMIDMSYGLYSSRPVVVRFVAGRTTQGWRLSKLRISCQP